MLESAADLLACPACHGALRWRVDERDGPRLIAARATCAACGAVYPVRDGIGHFLPPDGPPADPWAEVDSALARYLGAHPDIERRLLEGPLEALAPADRFFRALALDERGRFAEARAAYAAALPGVYTPESLACTERHLAALAGRLAGVAGPVVDLASGRGQLVERLAGALPGGVVATDVSPRVLDRTRRRLDALGLGGGVSFLAADAHRLPLRTGAVAAATSFAGLDNVADPAAAVRELRRAARPAGGRFLTPVGGPLPDGAGAPAPRLPALDWFGAAGWRVELVEPCTARIAPTPVGVLLEGFVIDAHPAAPAVVRSYLLVASAP